MELQDTRSAFVVPPFLCFLLIIIATSKLDGCNGGHGTPKAVVCREEEREALLSFKKGLHDPSNTLSSWVGEECCKNWKGVHCHNTTGHVLMLNLRGDEFPFDDSLSGEISSSLLDLKHLRYLDLSNNDFKGINIPKFLGSLSNLRYLNLYDAHFGGVVPHQLGNLSDLHHLDIVSSGYEISLRVEDVEWISGLPLLEYLDMSYVNLSSSKASNLLQVMNEHLHHLSVLRLSNCDLHTIHDPLPHVNFSSLLSLDLSHNYGLTSSSFHWLAHLSSLTDLNLAGSEIHGQIPSGIRNMSSLRFLDLSDNYFIGSNIADCLFQKTTLEDLNLGSNKLEGKLPNEHIGNLTSITYLDLSYNLFDGEVPRSLGNLCRSQLSKFSNYQPRKSLEFLSLRGNNFSGPLDALIGECKSLRGLDLGENQFSGHLPNELGQLRSLSFLSIDGNSFCGEIPISLGQISSLLSLDIMDNSFEGILSEKHLANLTSLKELEASPNHLLTVQISSDWTPPFQLTYLDLGSCIVGPSFPAWLGTQNNLYYLNMSYTGISDVIPNWFWTRSYDTVDLSHNQIMGSIPSLSSTHTYLGSNNFTGPLPQISSTVQKVDLSNNKFSGSLSSMLCHRRTNKEEKNSLRNLDISGNLLSGELPNCWMYWRELTTLKLGNNNLMGDIPSSMASLIYLGSLHLRNNHLSGNFPLAFKNCSLVVLDLSENDFTGNIPAWIGNLKGKFIDVYQWGKIYISGLMVLVLHSNKFNGSIPRELCHLNSLQILDLGNNNLSGTIPTCFGNFSSMIKSSNSTSPFPIVDQYNSVSGTTDTATLVTKGTEYEYKNNLGLLAGIDLSSNNLHGGIPEELTCLHGLVFLNLSHNHLRGKIPVKIGAMTSLESLDLSMNTLSGVIPQGIATISFLGHLNLSYNNLAGKIPSGTQIQGFSPLSFIGNTKLCGAPLNHDCDEDGKPKAPTVPDDGDDDDDDTKDNGWLDIKWFCLGTPWGFVVGFWAILAPLAFKRDWRHAYFRFLDEMKYKLLGWFL